MDIGPLVRYVKLRVAHAPGMPGTFSPPPRIGDPDIHYGTCVTHVPWCMPGSLTSGFPWCRWRGKRSWHSWRMRKPQFYVSGKRPMEGKRKTHFDTREEASICAITKTTKIRATMWKSNEPVMKACVVYEIYMFIKKEFWNRKAFTCYFVFKFGQ